MVLCKEGLMIQDGERFLIMKKPAERISGTFDGIDRQLKVQLQSLESTLRKAKLLESNLSSGEQERIEESVEKWKEAITQIVPELKGFLNEECSLRKFVTKILGLNLDTLELDFQFDDDEEEESDQSIDGEDDEFQPYKKSKSFDSFDGCE